MVNNDFTTTPGFSLYGCERKTRLLLPVATIAELETQAELAEEKAIAEEKVAMALKKAKATPTIMSRSAVEAFSRDIDILLNIDFDLASIRVNTQYDLADAMNLASCLLAKATAGLDRVSSQFSNDLLVAIALHLSYEQKSGNLVDVLAFLRDPRWDCARQLIFSLNQSKAFLQKDAAQWRNVFLKKNNAMTETKIAALIKHCYRHWTSVVQSVGKGVKRKVMAKGSVQVFNQDALAEAVVRVSEIKEERRAAGERILQNAHSNGGCRRLPDAKAANIKLEAAKSLFENLVEPIERLQMDLILSAAMTPQDFRISPILLLGDPGIGKTFLATQLATALGVATEKISAGGAQGGFQFTGSHSSWQSARPGLLFSLLAQGGSAAPVVVIDEVDKIHDSQYPVLPVLLDLLDAGTGQHFKDEYFEMEFDASRIIFVMTANSIEDVPPPLLSRVEVFNIPSPEPAQRLRIIEETARNLRRKTKRRIALDASTSESLSKRIDIDLRWVTRLVNEAFTRAMQAGDTVAHIAVPMQGGKRSIGFH